MTNEERHSRDPNTARDKNTPRKPIVSQNTPQVASKSQLSTQANDDVSWRLKLQSSNCFEKIMADIEGKMIEKIKRQQELTKSSNESKDAENVEAPPPVILLELEEDEDVNLHEEEQERARKNPLRIKAKRAWALIRRHIREQSMNKKQNKSSFQWSMLQQTLKNMTNMDAARGDLYNKYLNPQNPRQWTEGIKSIPQGFFARHGKEFMRKSAPPISKAKPVPKSAITTKSVTSRKSYRL